MRGLAHLDAFRFACFSKEMIVRITSKRQVTFPKKVMEHLRLRAGDTLVLSETKDGVLIRPRRLSKEKLAPLRNQVSEDCPPLDLNAVRHAKLDPDLRD